MSVALTPVAGAVEVRAVVTEDDAAEVHALLHDHVEWIALAAGLDLSRAQPAVELELAGPAPSGVARFIARVGGTAVGTVAVACDPDGTAELKRLYVRPVARGRGVADALVEAVVARAVEAGCRTIWLETLRGPMDRAIAVYRRHGFVESERTQTLHDVEGIMVMERPLVPARAA